MKDKFFNDLKEKIQGNFVKGGSHSFDHTQRVYNLAIRLAKTESVDLDILKAAVLLHDIARKKEDDLGGKICHAKEGGSIAEGILERSGFPREKIKGVCYAIKIHRHSAGIKPKTKEAAILQDADRLDALGAITIGRMFSSGGEIGRPMYDPSVPLNKKSPTYDSCSTIHGFFNKILKLKPGTFNTHEARKIAKGRYEFVEEFLNRFLKEWEGKL